MSKKARRPLTAKQTKPAPASRAAAVGFFALLPIAVAIGVVVGRSGSGEGDNEALLQALRNQQSAAPTTTTTASVAPDKEKKAGGEKGRSKGEGKVTKTANGDVHEVVNFEASKEKEEEDTRIVEENPEQTGENYIKAQQNLPDVVVVGGDPGSAPAPSSGVEP